LEHLIVNSDGAQAVSTAASKSRSRSCILHMQRSFADTYDIDIEARLRGEGPWALIEHFDETTDATDFDGTMTFSKEMLQYPHIRVTVGGVTTATDFNVNEVGVGFTPAAAGTPLVTQVVNIFYPNGTMPAAGWPTVYFPLFAGLAQNSNVTAFIPASQPPFTLLSRGYVIVVGTPTGSDVGHNGLGVFRNFGSAQYLDATQPQAEKDGAWTMQWLRAYGKLFSLDTNRLAILGNSGGGQVAAWAALHQDHADGTLDIITSQSSRADALILRITPCWYPGQTQATFPASHFKQAGVETIATALTQVSNGDKQVASYARYAFQDLIARELNRTMPVFIMNADPISSTDFSLTGGAGTLTNPTLSNAALDVHDGWSGYMAYQLLLNLDANSGTNFHATHSKLNHNGTALGTIETSNILNETGLATIVTDWLDEELDYTPPQPLVGANPAINVWLERR
jgi:hypothetical protein